MTGDKLILSNLDSLRVVKKVNVLVSNRDEMTCMHDETIEINDNHGRESSDNAKAINTCKNQKHIAQIFY